MTRWVVAREEDAWALLERCLSEGGAMGDETIAFVGWPVLRLKVEPGNGQGTPEITRALQRLQKAVYSAFALLKYGAANTRRLTRDDRYGLALKYTIGPGCTAVNVDFSGALREYLREAGKNTKGWHMVAMVLGLGLIVSSATVLGAWLNHTAELHKAKLQAEAQGQLIALTREVTENHAKQMALMKAVYDRSEIVRFAWNDYIPWRPPLMSVAPYSGTITLNDVRIDGGVAKTIAKVAAKAAKVERKRLTSDKKAPTIEAQWITTVTPEPKLPLAPPMRLGRNASA